MDTPPDIGTTIRQARQALGLSIEEFAAQVGASDSAVRNWETGRARPRDKIGRIEAVLGITLTPTTPAEQSPRLAEAGFARLLAEISARYAAVEDELAAARAEIARLTGNPGHNPRPVHTRPPLRLAGRKRPQPHTPDTDEDDGDGDGDS